MTTSDFDAKAAVAEMRAVIALRRKTRFRSSRLDKFKAELLAMLAEGATATMLQEWLRRQNCQVVLSTVTRWIDRHGPAS